MISRPIINVSYAILKILFSHQLRFQSVNVWAVGCYALDTSTGPCGGGSGGEFIIECPV